jgi:hypothetical protein
MTMTWKEVLDRVGEDSVATLVYLYFDELAQGFGRRADDYADPALIMDGLAGEDGSVDGNILNCAYERAFWRFKQVYGWRLEEPQWEEVNDLIWSLGC